MADDIRRERVERGEGALVRATSSVEEFARSLDAYQAAQADVAAVSEYLGSAEWFADRDADAAGELGEGVRAGILSEDLGYDLIVDNRELALRMLELATKILREL